MKQFFKFEGTAKRQEYWGVMAISVLITLVAIAMGITEDPALMLLMLATLVGVIWLQLATAVRRIRDAGMNVWWIVAFLVPYASFVATIVFGCLASVEGDKE